MATKTITVTEDSYSILKSAKREDESFSELIKRMMTPKRDLMKYVGIITDEEAKDIKAGIKELRQFSIKRSRGRG